MMIAIPNNEYKPLGRKLNTIAMKPLTLIVFSLIIFPCSLLAQIITPNSTVEECIAYIEQVANKNKLSTDESIEFAGTSYVVLHSPRHITSYIDINWASFSTLKVDASHEYMSPSVTFVFTDSLWRKVEMANRDRSEERRVGKECEC